MAWNDTAADYPRDRRTDELVAEQAARTPDAIAVTDALGHRSPTPSSRPAPTGSPATSAASASAPAPSSASASSARPRWWPCSSAVMKAGGAYVPMDPAFPPARLAMMAEDAALAVLVTEAAVEADLRSDPALEEALAAAGTRLVRLDADAAADRRGERGSAGGRGRGARRPRLRHLHLGLDGAAEGRDGGAPGADELPLLDGAGAGAGRRRHARGRDDALVRHRRARALPPARCGGRVVVASREEAADGAALAALLEREGRALAQARRAGRRRSCCRRRR